MKKKSQQSNVENGDISLSLGEAGVKSLMPQGVGSSVKWSVKCAECFITCGARQQTESQVSADVWWCALRCVVKFAADKWCNDGVSTKKSINISLGILKKKTGKC